MNSRKGYIFTVLSLILIIIAFALLELHDVRQSSRQSGLQAHILNTNSFLLQLEEDLPRAIKITGYRSMLGLEEHIGRTGLYIEDLDKYFTEVIMNGSVNGTGYDIMTNATLLVFEDRMEELAGQQGISLNISVTHVEIGHVDPWTVEVNVTLEVNATSRDASTKWSYETPLNANFSIIDLKDPLYTVGTLGRAPSVVRENNISRPFFLPNNDTSRLRKLWNESMYLANDSAPSLLMRFQGNFSASPHGIVSLVDTKLLDAQDLSVKTDRSVTDYTYFGDSPTSTNKIINMSDEFLLADEQLALFDVAGKTR